MNFPGNLALQLRSFSFPPALLPWLPLSSRIFGPPRRRAGIAEYFSHHPGKFTEVYPATPNIQVQPVLINKIAPAYFKDLRPTLPAAYVFSMQRAHLLGSAGWIVGAQDTLLVEASFWREPDFPHRFDTHFILSRKKARPLRQLKGRTLSLASDFSIGGFGHFLHDGLARLHLVEKAGYTLQDFDWIYLPHIDTPSTRSLISKLEFPPDRILQHDPKWDLETEELVATSYPGTAGNLPPYTPSFLRTRFAQNAAPANRKVFLSRKGFRRDLVNREDIEQLLLAHGFEICEPSRDDAVRACAEASIVVAQEGANFVNTLFTPPGARVLMLLPESGNTLPYGFTIAAAAGHKLWVQSCPLEDTTPGHEGISPVFADLGLFASALDEILAGT